MKLIIAGLPAVVTDNRGHKDVIVNGKNGYLVSMNDCTEMIKYIELIYLDKSVYARLADNARESAMKFDLINVMGMVKEIYEKI